MNKTNLKISLILIIIFFINISIPKSIATEETNKFADFFNSPQGTIIVAGIATVYSGILYNAAAEQEKIADNNIKKIERILKEFKDSFVSLCPKGRNDLAVPECYCYLENGTQNSERSKSQTCVALWAKGTGKVVASDGEYKGISQFVDPVGCLTLKNEFDENCKCKKFLDTKGNNACMKAVSVNIPPGLSTALVNSAGLKEISQMATNAGNGNPLFGKFNNGDLAKKAIANLNLRKQMIQKLTADDGPLKNTGFNLLNEKNVGPLANAILGQNNIERAMAKAQSALSLGNEQVLNQEALKNAAAIAGMDLSGGNGLLNKKEKTKEGMNFNFQADGNSGAATAQNFPEKEKNYNYKNSDISKQSDTSLFEIISHRYIQSGLKRLFDY